MPRRRRGEPGRLKIRLAELLQAEGFEFSEYDLRDTKGYYRSSPYSETVRWEGGGKTKDFGDLRIVILSWETMTNCVRFGIEVWHDDMDIPSVFMCGPKDPNSPTQTQQGSTPSVQD